MNRREFIGSAARLAFGPGLLRYAAVAAEESKEAIAMMPQEMRKHWIWTSVDPHAETHALRLKYAELKSRGLHGVFIGGGVDQREFDIIKAAGLEIHCWMWTTNRGDSWIREHHPDWYMVSRTGKSCFDHPPYVDYYRWVSPVIPGVRDYLIERVAELARHPAVSGVHLDYVRYPDVILPRALWKDYGLDQTEELPDYDFCYSAHTREAFKKAHGRDPIEIEDPAADQEWLKFRYDSVTELVRRLVKTAHEHHKEMTAAVFPTPSQARKICRQDWDKWPLDAVCPMTYHSFYDEPLEWVGDCIRENIQAVQIPVYAGLYMPAFSTPEEFAKGIRLVHKRGGAGVSLFGEVGLKYWEAFEEAAHS